MTNILIDSPITGKRENLTQAQFNSYMAQTNGAVLQWIVEPVAKHAEHDQSSHGSWAGNNQNLSDNPFALFGLSDNYQTSHRPAQGKDGGASLDDLTNGIYPDEVYSPRAVQIFSTGSKLDKKAHALIMEYKGKPDKEIRIYRAVPKKVDAKINTGDWVTPIKEYAEGHGESNLNNDYQILYRDVKAKEIFTSGDSWLEWGYVPEAIAKHAEHDQSSHGSWAGTNEITSDQKKAVQAYTQKLGDVAQWRSAAQNIRDGKTPDAPPEFVSSVKTLLNAIDEHSVTPTNAGGKVLLRSGVNWKGKLPAVGEIMSNPVASATWRHNVAEKFASSGDGKPVIIKYGSSTKGLDTSKFGAYLFGDEGEFIVSGKFEVVNRDKENGFTYVSVRPVGEVAKHAMHDQSTHGSWAGTGTSETTELSDDNYRDIIYSAKTVEQAYTSIAKRLGKNMKAREAELSEDEVDFYRGVENVGRDTKSLLEGKIKFTELQTWGQGIYVTPRKEEAAFYGTAVGLRLDKNAKIFKGEIEWDSAFRVDFVGGSETKLPEGKILIKPGKPQSDFVDMSRIKMNINDMGYPNYSISDLKNLYWASKGYDGFSPHGGEMVLFNGGVITINKSKVSKHADHDQSTHGNWANSNFNEETQGEQAQNIYFERYGITTDGKKEPVGISKDEIRSLDNYTADGFKEINQYLRLGGTSVFEEGSYYDQVSQGNRQNRVADLDKLIEESPDLFGDKNLYRVFSTTVLQDLKKGDVLTDKAFSSTTRVDITDAKNRDTLENLKIISDKYNTTAVILPSPSKSGKGLAVDYLKNSVSDLFNNTSTANNEKEVILPRKTPLKYMGHKLINEDSNSMVVAVFQRMDK